MVREARDITRRWLERRSGPGFRGAVFTGSATALAPDTQLPAVSDVDVDVLVADMPPKPGKVLVRVPARRARSVRTLSGPGHGQVPSLLGAVPRTP
jgi:hypothetical protein